MRAEPIRTERTRLTPIDAADGPELWDVIEGSRTHLERWLPWVPFNNTPEASRRYANACASDWDAGRAVRFGIRDRETDALLGVVGLDSCVHLHLSCELGYWLRADAAGKGIMTEAASACVRGSARYSQAFFFASRTAISWFAFSRATSWLCCISAYPSAAESLRTSRPKKVER